MKISVMPPKFSSGTSTSLEPAMTQRPSSGKREASEINTPSSQVDTFSKATKKSSQSSVNNGEDVESKSAKVKKPSFWERLSKGWKNFKEAMRAMSDLPDAAYMGAMASDLGCDDENILSSRDLGVASPQQSSWEVQIDSDSGEDEILMLPIM